MSWRGNSVTRPVILNFDLLLSSSEIGLKVSLMYFMKQINITSQFVEGWVPQSTHWNWNELNSIEVSCAWLWQVNALLHSLDIDESLQVPRPLGGQLPEFEQLWKEGYAQNNAVQNRQLVQRPPMSQADGWANDFQSQYGVGAGAWVDEFQNQGNQWVNQFQEVSSHLLYFSIMSCQNGQWCEGVLSFSICVCASSSLEPLAEQMSNDNPSREPKLSRLKTVLSMLCSVWIWSITIEVAKLTYLTASCRIEHIEVL